MGDSQKMSATIEATGDALRRCLTGYVDLGAQFELELSILVNGGDENLAPTEMSVLCQLPCKKCKLDNHPSTQIKTVVDGWISTLQQFSKRLESVDAGGLQTGAYFCRPAGGGKISCASVDFRAVQNFISRAEKIGGWDRRFVPAPLDQIPALLRRLKADQPTAADLARAIPV